MRKRLLLVAVPLLVVACGGSSDGSPGTTVAPTSPATTQPATTVPTTTSPATTTSVPATTTPTTAAPTTTSPATTTTEVCTATGDTQRKQSTIDPLTMSSLIGKDIRTGAHPCFERVVIELQGTGDFPGWWVEYVDDPVTLGESNDVVFLKGEATLSVRFGSWMQTMEYEGYQGSWDIFPTNVSHIEEMRMVENWEGVTIWAIGLDKVRAFSVSVLLGPPRLVIDIQTGV